jgi:hypothetical protein
MKGIIMSAAQANVNFVVSSELFSAAFDILVKAVNVRIMAKTQANTFRADQDEPDEMIKECLAELLDEAGLGSFQAIAEEISKEIF